MYLMYIVFKYLMIYTINYTLHNLTELYIYIYIYVTNYHQDLQQRNGFGNLSLFSHSFFREPDFVYILATRNVLTTKCISTYYYLKSTYLIGKYCFSM